MIFEITIGSFVGAFLGGFLARYLISVWVWWRRDAQEALSEDAYWIRRQLSGQGPLRPLDLSSPLNPESKSHGSDESSISDGMHANPNAEPTSFPCSKCGAQSRNISDSERYSVAGTEPLPGRKPKPRA